MTPYFTLQPFHTMSTQDKVTIFLMDAYDKSSKPSHEDLRKEVLDICDEISSQFNGDFDAWVRRQAELNKYYWK